MEPLFNGLFGIGGLLNPGVNAGPGSVPTGMNYAGTLANPGGSGSIESNVSVTINSSGQAESSIVGNSTELGKRIDDAVRGVLISEKRQGGLLAAS